MGRYVAKRLLMAIPVVLGVIFIVYLIMYLTPGDVTALILGSEWTEEASARLKHDLGMDRPFLVQFFSYVGNIFRGSLGNSYISRDPVLNQIAARFPNTVLLMLGSLVVCLAGSIPVGIWSATKPNSILSSVSTVIALAGLSLPAFWLGLILIMFFSLRLGLLPAAGLDSFKSLILPSITMGAVNMASAMRMTRSSMMECIRQDYIRTAKAKGVSRRDVIYKHALGNAWLPIVTTIGLMVSTMLGGAVLTETVFAIPGMGRLMITAINTRDTPTVVGCLVVFSVCVALCNLTADIVMAFVDPRIRAQYAGKGRS